MSATIKDDKTFLQRLTKSLNSLGFGGEGSEDKKQPSVVLKAFDQEQKRCIEIVYKPDVKDAHGEWMSSDTIKIAEESFRRNLDAGVVKANLFHVTPTEKFSIERSWILAEDATFDGREEVVKKGTWLTETHYTDDKLWEMKKSGVIGGLSLGGYGKVDEKTGEIIKLFFSKEEYKQALAEMEKED